MKLEEIERLWREVHKPSWDNGGCEDAACFAVKHFEKILAVVKAYKEIKSCGYDHEPFCCCRLDMFKPVDEALEELEKAA